MAEFLTSIGTIITSAGTWLASVSTALLSNDIFMLFVGIIVFTMFVGIIKSLARGIKSRGGKRR